MDRGHGVGGGAQTDVPDHKRLGIVCQLQRLAKPRLLDIELLGFLQRRIVANA